MATALQGKKVAQDISLRSVSLDDTLTDRGEYDLATANGGNGALVVNDTVDLVILPGNCVPVDLLLDADDLDSGGSPALVLKVGIYDPTSGNPTSDDDCFITTTIIGQTGGVARMNAVAGLRLAPVDYDRYVRVTVSTAPATGATTGKLGVQLQYKGADHRFL